MAKDSVAEPRNGEQESAQEGAPTLLRGPWIISWWRIVAAGAMAIFLGLGALELVPLLAYPIALLIFAVSIAAALAPIVERLEHRLPRPVAILIVYLAVILGFAMIGVLTIPTLIAQAQRIGKLAPDLIARATDSLASYGFVNTSLASTLGPQLGQISSTLVSLPLTLFSTLLEIFLVIVMSVYWLFVGRPLRDYVLSLIPAGSHQRARFLFGSLGRAMGGYIRATVINGLVMGFLTFLGLYFIGADFPLVLGLLAGFFELVPIIGPIISGLLVFLAMLLQSTTLAVIAVVYMLLLQQLESHLLVPNIMRSQTEISPLLVILALFAGDLIGGLLGALIAIPVVSAIQVLVVEILIPRLRAGLAEGVPDLNEER